MKTRGTKILAGLMTAGMLSATGVVGIQLMGVTTTETVNYEMEENYGYKYLTENIITYDNDRSSYTNYKYLSDFEKSLPKGDACTRVWMKGYGLPVLLVAYPEDLYGNRSKHVKIYTEKSGRNVKCIGDIRVNNSLQIKNGVILAWNQIENKNGNAIGVIQDVLVSKDGDSIFVKDYYDGRDSAITTKGTHYGWCDADDGNKFHYFESKAEEEKFMKRWIYDWNDENWITFKIIGK